MIVKIHIFCLLNPKCRDGADSDYEGDGPPEVWLAMWIHRGVVDDVDIFRVQESAGVLSHFMSAFGYGGELCSIGLVHLE